MKFGIFQTTTRDARRRLLLDPPARPGQLLLIDGGPALPPEKSFPIIPSKVSVVPGQANILGLTPHLHF